MPTVATVVIAPCDLGPEDFRGSRKQAYRIFQSLSGELNQFERFVLREYLHLPIDKQLRRQVRFYPISLKVAQRSVHRRLLVLALTPPTA